MNFGLMNGISGLGQGAIQGMMARRQHDREDQRDAMAQDFHGLRMENMNLGMDHTRQQMEQGAESHGVAMDRAKQDKWARDMAHNYRNAAQFLASGRHDEFAQVFNRFLPEENQIVGMQPQEDGTFMVQYGGGEDDREVLTLAEIGKRLRAMGNPEAWMEQEFGPKQPGYRDEVIDGLGLVQRGPDNRIHQLDPNKMPGGASRGNYNPQTAYQHIDQRLRQYIGQMNDQGQYFIPPGLNDQYLELLSIAEGVEAMQPGMLTPGNAVKLARDAGVLSLQDAQRIAREQLPNRNFGMRGPDQAEVDALAQQLVSQSIDQAISRLTQQFGGQGAQAPRQQAPSQPPTQQGVGLRPPPQQPSAGMQPQQPQQQAVPQQGAPVRIETEEQFMSLPSGTVFIAPDGSERVKP